MTDMESNSKLLHTPVFGFAYPWKDLEMKGVGLSSVCIGEKQPIGGSVACDDEKAQGKMSGGLQKNEAGQEL